MRNILGFLFAVCFSASSHAARFAFSFFDLSDNLVGTGVLNLAGDPINTQIPLDAQPFSIKFNLQQAGIFTDEDIAGSVSDVGLRLSELPDGRQRLQFTGDQGPLFGGSLLLENQQGFLLSFEPALGSAGSELYLVAIHAPEGPQPLFLGRYFAATAPAQGLPDGGATFWPLAATILCLITGSRFASLVRLLPLNPE